MTKVDILGPKGHETVVLPPEEAEKLIAEEYGKRYFVRDQKTREILREIKLEEDQEIALIPIAGGG